MLQVSATTNMTALGDKFDVRDFHEVVLKNGPVPLHVLRELVMKYIADRGGEIS